MIDFAKLTRLATVTIDVEQNTELPGPSAADAQELARILTEWNRGNPWPWCLVTVKVSYAGLEGWGSVFTGYPSEAVFRASETYLELLDEAYRMLAERLTETYQAIREVLAS